MFKGKFASAPAIPALASAGRVSSNLFISSKAQALLISLCSVEHTAVWMRKKQGHPLAVDCSAFRLVSEDLSNNSNELSWPWLAV